MTALTQFSYTSRKKLLIASSVAALVGLAPTAVAERDEAVVICADGWCRRRNFVLAPVTKQEM
jgi:hypothetical protein